MIKIQSKLMKAGELNKICKEGKIKETIKHIHIEA
jgi:hypothetical protein